MLSGQTGGCLKWDGAEPGVRKLFMRDKTLGQTKFVTTLSCFVVTLVSWGKERRIHVRGYFM